MKLSVLDSTGDSRGIGGDRKHADLLVWGLEAVGAEIVERAAPLDLVHDGWLLLPDVFCKSDSVVEFVEKWPGRVCQLILCSESVYGRKREDARRTERLLERADVVVQTGPLLAKYRSRSDPPLTLPYVPWAPERELVELRDDCDWSRPNSVLVTGTLRASKGQRELAFRVLEDDDDYPCKKLTLLGNSMMWFSDELRKKLAVLPDAEEVSGFGQELWLRRDGAPKKSFREKPWVVTRHERAVRYLGAYRGVPALAKLLRAQHHVGWRFLHVNPTKPEWSPGHLEYSTLEGIAAGLPVVPPDHVPVRSLYPRGLEVGSVAALHNPARVAEELLTHLERH